MPSAGSAGSSSTDKLQEKRILVAYLRMCGATQRDAGAAVGRSERTVQAWEADRASWAQARQEAGERWLDEVTDAARGAVMAAVQAGDAEIGLKILERTVAALAPPKMRLDIGAIPWDHLDDDALRRLAAGEHPAKVLGAWHANGTTPRG